MSVGRKNLLDLSDRQCRRRVKKNPLSILLGDAEIKKARPHSPGTHEPSESVNPHLHAPCDHDQSPCNVDFQVLFEKLEDDCSTKEHDANATSASSESMGVASSAASMKVCMSCLVCICFSDCSICKHDSSGCRHCDSCIDGVFFDSDDDPWSSEDEGEVDSDLAGGSNKLESPSNDTNNASASVKQKLSTWSLNYQINHKALKELLEVLNECLDAGLPKDPRTLLHTPASPVVTRSCPPGRYWHAGLEKGLRSLDLSNPPSVLELTVNIDGLPLSRSSHSSFWPILCGVKGFDKIILVGAYFGAQKPHDANDFMEEYVTELNHLCQNGLSVNGKTIPVRKKRFVCDAPAKSFGMKRKCPNAYCSCTKCLVEGEYIQGRVVFLDLDAPLRTDAEFRAKKQEEHHTGVSILEKIVEFDLINDVPLDYMHLVLLGVVRKILNLLASGKVGIRLQGQLLNAMSEKLEMLKAFIPSDFVRQTRSLTYLRLFKATELRLLLFYVLPVVFEVLLDEYKERYNNFLVLHVAVTILASEQHLKDFGFQYPNDLLRAFVGGFQNIYGREQVSHNVHNLIHLAADVKNHGVLDDFSLFRFENFLQSLKRLIRKGDKPLEQLAKRYAELEAISVNNPPQKSVDHLSFSGKSTSSCLPPGCGDPQVRCLQFEKFSLDISTANRYCGLTNGAIVEIHNIAFHKRLNSMVIIGKYFKSRADLYDYPLRSSQLGIFKVNDLSRIQWWPVRYVCMKYLRMPYKKAHVVFPILHTVPIRN